MFQHFLARKIREHLKYRETSLPAFLAEFGEAPGLTPDRQRRMLRGETSATLADFAFWVWHFPSVADDLNMFVATWQGLKSAQEAAIRPS